jgi:hypothetical protein
MAPLMDNQIDRARRAVLADEGGPVSVKEFLAQLDGRFPMDEAVIEGRCAISADLGENSYYSDLSKHYQQGRHSFL